VTSGDEIPIEMPILEDPDLFTRAQVNARALELLNYYQYHVCTWTATFNERSDFEIFQKLQFLNGNAGIPNGIYRIIGIKYRYEATATEIINQVTVELIEEGRFRTNMLLKRAQRNAAIEVQALIEDYYTKKAKAEPGEVVSIVGEEVVVKTERGPEKYSRTPV